MSDDAFSLNRDVHAALPRDAIAAHAAVDALLFEFQAQEARTDAAYKERNQVVAALARCFPSGIAQTPIEGWAPEWCNCVYIDLPTGQASWHFHTREAHLFAGLPNYPGQWDGHTTEEKYERLARLTATPKVEQLAAAMPVCSCPSGDGSLRWPCSVHPAAPQAQPDQATNAGLIAADGHLSALVDEAQGLLAELVEYARALESNTRGGQSERGEVPLMDRVDDWLAARPDVEPAPQVREPMSPEEELREFEAHASELGLDLTRFDGIAAPWRSVETSKHWQTWRARAGIGGNGGV
ncbi:hypothetical protein RQP53_03690 [Paucibacter sp. APW11]|uniref:WDGH domain-containing protein n=1 Tax=Roseateles aquae TaxID=3077235 RepID=A0ABU3P737_9BURK|nr:hypothetical protein [Paucibacter sp. APW11]MDT8998376.1 hypothetical protein [Paucibacter sp. APW11]